MKIKLRTRTNERNNIHYHRTFEIEEYSVPLVGDIYHGAEVIQVTPIELDCEEQKAADYDCFEVHTREDYYTEEDEDDIYYIAVPVEY